MRVAKYTVEEKLAFGKNLKAYVDEHEIKPGELAKELHISPPRVSAALSGDVSDDNMERIAEYLKVSLAEFLTLPQDGLNDIRKEYMSLKMQERRLVTTILVLLSLLSLCVLGVYAGCHIYIWEVLLPPLLVEVTEELHEMNQLYSTYLGYAEVAYPLVTILGIVIFVLLGKKKAEVLWVLLSNGIVLVTGTLIAVVWREMTGKWHLLNLIQPHMLVFIVDVLWLFIWVIRWCLRRRRKMERFSV